MKMKIIMVLMMVVAVVLTLCSATATATPAEMPKYDLPPCLDKLANCYKNVNYTQLFNATNLDGEIKLPCCTEWEEEITDNTKCICDNFVGNPYSNLTDTITLCKINANPDTVCQGVSANSQGNDANKIVHAIGLLPFLFLILTMISKF